MNTHQGFFPKRKQGISVSVVRCSNCGLLYSNPMPVPENIAQHYGIPPDQYWTNFNFETDHVQTNLYFNSFRQIHDFSPGMKMLDVGAGTGKIMQGFANLGFDVFGIEPSLSFYEFAQKRVGFPLNQLSCTSVEEARFPSDFFDYIHFTAVLEHLYNPDEAIKKILPWLKPDGVMLIVVPQSTWLMARLMNLYYRITGSDCVTNLSPMHPPYHLYEFTLKSFTENGRINGYTIVQKKFSTNEGIMPRLLRWLAKKIMNITNTQMEINVWVKKISP